MTGCPATVRVLPQPRNASLLEPRRMVKIGPDRGGGSEKEPSGISTNDPNQFAISYGASAALMTRDS
jgi:hypothetical protein